MLIFDIKLTCKTNSLVQTILQRLSNKTRFRAQTNCLYLVPTTHTAQPNAWRPHCFIWSHLLVRVVLLLLKVYKKRTQKYIMKMKTIKRQKWEGGEGAFTQNAPLGQGYCVPVFVMRCAQRFVTPFHEPKKQLLSPSFLPQSRSFCFRLSPLKHIKEALIKESDRSRWFEKSKKK
jgi:hypothetical protein